MSAAWPSKNVGSAHGLGVLPGTDLAHAATVVDAELPQLHIPILPARGLSATPLALTLSMLAELHISAGPRGWALSPRSTQWDQQLRDRRSRDTDLLEETWQPTLQREPGAAPITLPVLGPWTVGLLTELPDGHKVLSDAGAHRELTEALHVGVRQWAETLQKRWGQPVQVQWSEPAATALLAGGKHDTHQFDAFPPLPAEEMGGVLHQLGAPVLDFSAAAQPAWTAARRAEVQQLLIGWGVWASDAEQMDQVGAWLDEGRRLGIVLGSELLERGSAGERATQIHELIYRLGLAAQTAHAIDFYADAARCPDLVAAGQVYREGVQLVERLQQS